jgi:hypothetical protein
METNNPNPNPEMMSNKMSYLEVATYLYTALKWIASIPKNIFDSITQSEEFNK